MPFREATTIATDVRNEDPKDYVMKTFATIETGTELKTETEFNTRVETETKPATEAEPKMEIGTQVETETETTTEIEILTQGTPRMIIFLLIQIKLHINSFYFSIEFPLQRPLKHHSNQFQALQKIGKKIYCMLFEKVISMNFMVKVSQKSNELFIKVITTHVNRSYKTIRMN